MDSCMKKCIVKEMKIYTGRNYGRRKRDTERHGEDRKMQKIERPRERERHREERKTERERHRDLQKDRDRERQREREREREINGEH